MTVTLKLYSSGQLVRTTTANLSAVGDHAEVASSNYGVYVVVDAVTTDAILGHGIRVVMYARFTDDQRGMTRYQHTVVYSGGQTPWDIANYRPYLCGSADSPTQRQFEVRWLYENYYDGQDSYPVSDHLQEFYFVPVSQLPLYAIVSGAPALVRVNATLVRDA